MSNNLIQSISTVALVLVTIYYAWQTRQTVKELNNQRNIGIRPVLFAKQLILKDPNAQGRNESCLICNLDNIGNGPALKIKVSLYEPGSNNLIVTSTNFIDFLTKDGTSNDNHIHIDNKRFNQIKYKENKEGEMVSYLKLVLNYYDLYNNMYFSERIFYFKKSNSTFNPTIGSFQLESKTISEVKNKFSIRNFILGKFRVKI